MIYREYGRTGKKVSAISFGGMRFEDQKNVDACAELLCKARMAGINYFDTAPGYGDSEKLFGAAFKTLIKESGRDSFFVATKTGSETVEGARRNLETSLERMGIGHVDFYHVWCVMSREDFELRRRNGVLEEFLKFKEEGLIRHICISTHMGGGEIRQVLDQFDFDGMLLGYSAMNFNYRDEGVAAAARKGLGIVAMNPLGGGIIPKNPDVFSFLKTREEETVVEAALRFLLDEERLTSSLVGFSNMAQLGEAVRAVEGYRRISSVEKDRMKAMLKESFNEMCTGCGYCDSCPQKIPIPRLMDTYNQYLFAGKEPKSIINRLKWHWDIEAGDPILRKCTKCGRCEILCTQKLPIMERILTIRETADKDLSGQAAAK